MLMSLLSPRLSHRAPQIPLATCDVAQALSRRASGRNAGGVWS
jgi:hypothetical protein